MYKYTPKSKLQRRLQHVIIKETGFMYLYIYIYTYQMYVPFIKSDFPFLRNKREKERKRGREKERIIITQDERK